MGSIRTLLYSEPWANSAQHIEGSLKFDKDKVQYLRKTLGSGNTKTFTFSYWFNYVSTRGSSRYISTGYSVGGNSYGFYIGDNGNAITFNDSGTNSAGYNVRPSAVMRDRGWYHLVFNLDTTESNEDDRVRIYINGVQQLDFSTNTRPNQDATGNMNSNGLELTIGCWNYPAGGGYSDALEGHLSQFYHIDGQALDPSYFGFTDPLTNTWRPKKFRIEDAPTTSWGTNGFYLPFDGSNSMPIGYDQSGTGNNFTLRNLNGTVSIDKATGAFPFWNTVSGGNVASAGVRTDSYSPGQLVAAVPFNAGVAKDYSDKANGGSTAKTLSNTGSITFPITYRNFYDSTMYLANAQNQQLGFTASDDFEFAGDFCIECWFRPTDTSAGDGSLWVLQKTSGGEAYFAFNYDAADTLFNIYLNTGSVTWTPSSATVSFNEWNHTALTRAGTSLKLWVNGINIDTRTTSGTLGFPASQQTLTRIGGGAGTSVNSYIQDFRIYKGTSKYTTNFLVGSTNPSIVATSPSGIVYNSEPEEQLSRSVDFDGTGDYLSIPVNNSDFDWAAGGSLTIEAFVNMNVIDGQTYNSIINRWNGSGKYSFGLDIKSNGNLFFYRGNGSTITTHESSGITIGLKQWHHIAVVKDGTTGRFFINGQACGTFTWNEAFTNSTSIPLHLGNLSDGNVYPINGRISNARIVNGTAVYTSSFKPPTKPLENISGTVLLCCNDSSVTGSTVTPVTLNAQGNPQAITDSPFDDPDGFKFGEDSDENIIKCGSYTGNGDATNGTRVYLGFEPQWLLIKSTGFTEHWHCFDCMRGMVSGGGNDMRLEVNYATTEYTAADFIDVHPDGFTAYFNPNVNKNNENFVYVAVRRTDGLVGKPTESGTDVFTTTTGLNSSVLEYVSGFVTDFAIAKTPSGTGHWYTSARLIQRYFLKTNETDAQSLSGSGNTQFEFDSNVGWSTQAWGTNYQSWMWKRHTGLDVVTYTGVSGTQTRTHSLGVTPEMIWVKCRTGGSDQWCVGHKDLTGGWTSNHLRLNESSTESSSDQFAIAPTSTHWSTASGGLTNNNNGKYIAMLFASVDGISKVGSFAGSSSDVTLNLGFVPRFLMVKGRTGPSGTNWTVWDNIRGITGNYTSGGADTPRMYLNANSASSSGANDNVFAVNSGGVKGITIVTGPTWNNNQEYNYIYYAHA